MKEPKWISKKAVMALHEEQLDLFGGLAGIRDENLLESALARPKNLFVYGTPDIFEMAASLAFGLAKNHPFNDANKRTSYGTCMGFLRLNLVRIEASIAEKVAVMVDLAEGKISEEEFAKWLKKNSIKLK